MTDVVDLSTGQLLPVKEEEVIPALRSGKYGVLPNQRIPVILNGQVGTVEGKDLGQALAAPNSRLATQGEEHAAEIQKKYGEHGGLANDLGVLRGASAGLSDIAIPAAARWLGGEDWEKKAKEVSAGVEEANPTRSLLGEGAGVIGGLALGGATPIGAISKAGRAAEGAGALSAVGGVGGAALRYGARGATEGALIGLSKGVSEDYRADKELSAEALLAHATGGALAGAVGGAALGAGGELLGQAGERLASGAAPKKVSHWFAEFAKGRQAAAQEALAHTPSDMGMGHAAWGMVTGHPLAGVGLGLAKRFAAPYGNAALGGIATGISKVVGSFDSQLVNAARGIIGEGITEASEIGLQHIKLGSYEEEANAVRMTTQSPQQYALQAAEDMGSASHFDPDLANAMVSTALRAAQYLQSKLPTRTPTNYLQPQFQKEEVSGAEKYDFLNAVRGVRALPHVLGNLSRGKIVSQEVDAFRAVYPKAWVKLERMLAHGLVGSTKAIDYKSVVRLGLLLGKPIDPSMTRETMQAVQRLYHSDNKVAAAESAGINLGPEAASGIDQLAKELAPQAEAIANRNMR